MALKACKECTQEISSKADSCPHCGVKIKRMGIMMKMFLGFIAFSIMVTLVKENTPAPDLRNKIQKEWAKNKQEHLKNLNQKLKDKRYEEVFTFLDKYKNYMPDNKEVAQMWAEAKEKHYLGLVKPVPASNLRLNMELYQVLAGIRLSNKKYAQKAAHYKKKLDKKNREIEEKYKRRIASIGKEPKPSAWDGTYREVERYLKQVANDPESIDIDQCSDTFVVEDTGWIVLCSFRGKNAFGALIKNVNWFVIRHGMVVAVEKPDKYKIN